MNFKLNPTGKKRGEGKEGRKERRSGERTGRWTLEAHKYPLCVVTH